MYPTRMLCYCFNTTVLFVILLHRYVAYLLLEKCSGTCMPDVRFGQRTDTRHTRARFSLEGGAKGCRGICGNGNFI